MLNGANDTGEMKRNFSFRLFICNFATCEQETKTDMIGFANAKINLGLDIVRRRPDGYHDIVTVFYPIKLNDVVEVVPAAGEQTTLTCYGRPIDCPPEKNLMMKACRLMQEQYGLPHVDMYIYKHIPDGAGLGGGSSDASKVMLLMNEMFSAGASLDDLARLSAKIGADCPFFIHNTPMLATGIGDVLSPCEVSLRGKWLVVVKPAVSVPTKVAYANVTPAQPVTPIDEIIKLPAGQWQGLLKNDFEPSVMAEFPIISSIKQTLLDGGAVYASMSGSGSAVFGIFDSAKLAEDVTNNFTGCDKYVMEL